MKGSSYRTKNLISTTLISSSINTKSAAVFTATARSAAAAAAASSSPLSSFTFASSLVLIQQRRHVFPVGTAAGGGGGGGDNEKGGNDNDNEYHPKTLKMKQQQQQEESEEFDTGTGATTSGVGAFKGGMSTRLPGSQVGKRRDMDMTKLRTPQSTLIGDQVRMQEERDNEEARNRIMAAKKRERESAAESSSSSSSSVSPSSPTPSSTTAFPYISNIHAEELNVDNTRTVNPRDDASIAVELDRVLNNMRGRMEVVQASIDLVEMKGDQGKPPQYFTDAQTVLLHYHNQRYATDDHPRTMPQRLQGVRDGRLKILEHDIAALELIQKKFTGTQDPILRRISEKIYLSIFERLSKSKFSQLRDERVSTAVMFLFFAIIFYVLLRETFVFVQFTARERIKKKVRLNNPHGDGDGEGVRGSGSGSGRRVASKIAEDAPDQD